PGHPGESDTSARGAKRRRRRKRRNRQKLRFAAYIRISSEDQVGNFSMDAQLRAIKTWVAAKKAVLVKVYEDEAKSARTVDRPGFQQMRRDARKGKFDALVVHKFDRFARNRADALAVKSLLRNDYGIKVYSVSEPSEDSDGAIGALIEGIMEAVADWYSKNLSTEVAKGKKERTTQGLHNNIAPFGYCKDENKVLVPNEHEYSALKEAFAHYATGKYSDADIAAMLNKRGYRTRRGRRFSKDTLRELLQNQTYLGKVRYQKYQRRSDGTRSRDEPVAWFDGKHDALIDEELFQQCQVVRAQRRSHRQSTARYHPYLLRNLIYCYHCCTHRPAGEVVATYGKMRPQTHGQRNARYYRCRAREMGYSCQQKGISAEDIDSKVVRILMNLKPVPNWRIGITKAMGELLGEKDLEDRLQEIRQKIKRMDMRWDNGFISDEDEYIRLRLALQQEMEQLTPVPDDDLQQAADLLKDFPRHWRATEGDEEARHRLVELIVERVYAKDDQVVAMTLRSNFHLVLGHKMNEPTDFSIGSSSCGEYLGGPDGARTRDLWLDRPVC
ncbi:MAG: recombinase family protein, partial [Anaerolineae bacterium]|nr:recombinase family protein [Anaerolineae bacterium]